MDPKFAHQALIGGGAEPALGALNNRVSVGRHDHVDRDIRAIVRRRREVEGGVVEHGGHAKLRPCQLSCQPTCQTTRQTTCQTKTGDDEEVEDEEEDDRSYPIGPTARFTIGGKPLELEEFISTTTGKLADRERVEPQPQSPPLTKSVVWASRRPLTGD